MDGIKTGFTNKNYLLLMGIFSCLFACYTAVGNVISVLLEPIGYGPLAISVTGVLFILSGVASSMFVGNYLKKNHRYLLTIRVISFATTAFFLTGCWTVPHAPFWLLSVNVIFLGSSIIPVIPTGNAFSIELTYPLPAAVANGLMLMMAYLLAFLMSLAAANLAQIAPVYCMILLTTVSLLAGILTLFMEEDLRRIKAEQQLDEIRQTMGKQGEILEVTTYYNEGYEQAAINLQSQSYRTLSNRHQNVLQFGQDRPTIVRVSEIGDRPTRKEILEAVRENTTVDEQSEKATENNEPLLTV